MDSLAAALQSSPTSGGLKPGGRQLLQWLPCRGLWGSGSWRRKCSDPPISRRKERKRNNSTSGELAESFRTGLVGLAVFEIKIEVTDLQRCSLTNPFLV